MPPGEIRPGWDFSAYFIGYISGRVYNDYNASGVLDPVESGLGNRTVYIDADGSGSYTSADPISITRSDGSYGFVDYLERGTYVIREVPVADWFVTDPESHSIDFTYARAAYNRNFGRTRLGGVSGTIYYNTAADGYRNDTDAKLSQHPRIPR